MIWGETEGAASNYFTRKTGLSGTVERKVFSRLTVAGAKALAVLRGGGTTEVVP